MSGDFLAVPSNEITPSPGTCDTVRRVSGDRIDVSRTSRRMASPSPAAKPIRAPRPMLSGGLGETGTGLSVGPEVTARYTVGSLVPGGVSRSATYLTRTVD